MFYTTYVYLYLMKFLYIAQITLQLGSTDLSVSEFYEPTNTFCQTQLNNKINLILTIRTEDLCNKQPKWMNYLNFT